MILLLLPSLLLLHVVRGDREGSRDLSSEDFARGADIQPYSLPWWHPEIEWMARNRIPGPSNHPRLDNDPEFQRFLKTNTDEGHRFFDGRNGYIRQPWRLPRGHPNCDNYFIYEELPVHDLPTVHFDHPDIHEAYLNGEHLPEDHPSVSGLLARALPDGHPDVDDLFLEHPELPDWHPDLQLLVDDNPIEPIYVFSGHPHITNDSPAIDDHPSVHHLFEAHLPESHPNVDDLMREGFELPSWHPRISQIVIPRSIATSPGSILCLVIATIVLIIMLARNITKCRNSKRTIDIIVPKNNADKVLYDETSSSGDSLSESQDGSTEVIRRDQEQPGLSLSNPNQERILVYKEKKSSWKEVFGRRIGKGSRSTGDAVILLCYLAVNVGALFASPDYDLGLGFGSLSAGNTLLVFITAARNSVFTWFAGVTFDQVLVYHRFFGRVTVLFAIIHSGFYVDDIYNNFWDPIIYTGLISLGFGIIIVVSSLNYFRRKYFNLFIWSHIIAFVGFIIGLFLHASAARPFIYASVACYSIDKCIQQIWKMPRSTTVFRKVDDRTVHVQFAKGSLSKMLGRHKCGQYVFVNFPSLSLQEWHPFSIASGPSDPHVDIYIKALGDHTKKIVKHAEECAAKNKQVKVRSDGPYGTLPFNHCRYGSIVFVAGGIGITPVISVLKDIYGAGSAKKHHHCIRNVSVVWIVPHACEASLFSTELNSIHLKSLEDSLMPDFDLAIHATRDTEDTNAIPGQQVVYSRPNFESVMNQCVEKKPEDLRSILVYACGPGAMVNQLWDVTSRKNKKDLRVDFYHETFEF